MEGTYTDRRGVVWPASLREFMELSFLRSSTLSEPQKVVFHREIEQLLNLAIARDEVFSNDWSVQKVPVLDGGKLVLASEKKKKRAHKESLEPPGELPGELKGEVKGAIDSELRKKQRLERFQLPPKPVQAARTPSAASPGETAGAGARIYGRNQNLEKRYLRLTSEPDPEQVRPVSVLQLAVKRLVSLVDSKPYSYIKDQFKAIRQDLTVQHVTNDFAMYVYETNSRISIENNDLGEMNQCMTQIEYLFGEKVTRDRHLNCVELEFICYRILYNLMVGNDADILKIRYKLSKKSYADEFELEKLLYVTLALQLHLLMVGSDYSQFFRLVPQFEPLKLAHLLVRNYLMEKQIVKTLSVVLRAYRKVSMDFLVGVFKMDRAELEEFLDKHGLGGLREGDTSALRPVIAALMARTNFKKIDIKGQV